MPQLIDFTPALSRAYSRIIEAPGVSQDAIDFKAAEILRGLTDGDVSEVLYEVGQQIKTLVQQGHEFALGHLVQTTVNDYCQRIAIRVLEA